MSVFFPEPSLEWYELRRRVNVLDWMEERREEPRKEGKKPCSHSRVHLLLYTTNAFRRLWQIFQRKNWKQKSNKSLAGNDGMVPSFPRSLVGHGSEKLKEGLFLFPQHKALMDFSRTQSLVNFWFISYYSWSAEQDLFSQLSSDERKLIYIFANCLIEEIARFRSLFSIFYF